MLFTHSWGAFRTGLVHLALASMQVWNAFRITRTNMETHRLPKKGGINKPLFALSSPPPPPPQPFSNEQSGMGALPPPPPPPFFFLSFSSRLFFDPLPFLLWDLCARVCARADACTDLYSSTHFVNVMATSLLSPPPPPTHTPCLFFLGPGCAYGHW